MPSTAEVGTQWRRSLLVEIADVTFLHQRIRDDSNKGGYRNGGLEACFPESHAAAVKHNVTASEKTIGIIKKYFQARTVIPAKQSANVRAVPRMSANDSGGSPPSCHANTTARRRNALTKSPNPT